MYFERVIPPRARPLATPPPNFLFGDDFPKFPRPLKPCFEALLDLMISSRLISILSSILICLRVPRFEGVNYEIIDLSSVSFKA